MVNPRSKKNQNPKQMAWRLLQGCDSFLAETERLSELVVYPLYARNMTAVCSAPSFLEIYAISQVRLLPKKLDNGSFRFVIPKISGVDGALSERRIIYRSCV